MRAAVDFPEPTGPRIRTALPVRLHAKSSTCSRIRRTTGLIPGIARSRNDCSVWRDGSSLEESGIAFYVSKVKFDSSKGTPHAKRNSLLRNELASGHRIGGKAIAV